MRTGFMVFGPQELRFAPDTLRRGRRSDQLTKPQEAIPIQLPPRGQSAPSKNCTFMRSSGTLRKKKFLHAETGQRPVQGRGKVPCAGLPFQVSGSLSPAERCRSGRTGRSRKPLWVQAHPGFESLSLRQTPLFLLNFSVMKRAVACLGVACGDALDPEPASLPRSAGG